MTKEKSIYKTGDVITNHTEVSDTFRQNPKTSIKEKINAYRHNRSLRTWVLIGLLVIILIMLIFRGKMKGLLLILLVVVLVALGIHLTDYDVDLGTLFRTHSFEQSRVETKKGIKIIGSECVTDTINCAHFSTQKEAQDKYEYCAEKIAKINSYDTYRIKNLDIYGLDGDNDGIVCEILK